jgi:hypothetical protein
MIYAQIIIGAAVIVLVLVSIVRYAIRIGDQCAFCGGRAIPLKRASTEDQETILAYFEKIEQRHPCADYVSVCTTCKRVDDGRLYPGTVIQGHYRCRSCGTAFPVDETMACDNCGAKHQWVAFEAFGGHLFFLPERQNDENANTQLDPIAGSR